MAIQIKNGNNANTKESTYGNTKGMLCKQRVRVKTKETYRKCRRNPARALRREILKEQNTKGFHKGIQRKYNGESQKGSGLRRVVGSKPMTILATSREAPELGRLLENSVKSCRIPRKVAEPAGKPPDSARFHGIS